MSTWYYSNVPGERHGPVDDEALLALDRDGRLRGEHLVWREGMGEWQPWASQREALLIAHAPSAAASAAALDPPGAERSPYAAPAALPHAGSGVVVRGGEVVYAGFWKRTAAVMIDGIVTAMLSYAVQLPLLLALGLGTGALAADNPFESGMGISLFAVVYGIGLLIPLVYFAWMHSSSQQATLGKMAVGIKVVRTSGERIGFWRAIGRYFGYLLSSLLLTIGLIMAAFTQRKQALHDFMSDTLVVDRWAFTDRPDLQRKELGVVAWVVLILLGGLIGLVLMAIVAAIALPLMSR